MNVWSLVVGNVRLYIVSFRADLGWSVETRNRLLLLCRSTRTKTCANSVLRDSVHTSPTSSERTFRGVRKIAESEY
jgi:hypothetical protein